MRDIWIKYLEKITYPILAAAAHGTLKKDMPVYNHRNEFQYLEAFGRIVCGIAPWLNLPLDNSNEGILRKNYLELTIKAITNLVDPESVDYIDFGSGSQALVDAAYLTQGLLRSPNLWNALSKETQENVFKEVIKTRLVKPPKNNWLLFASMIETFLLAYNNKFNRKRLLLGVKKFIKNYYIGDGFYGDGKHFSIDHYNSYVIHPMLTDILTYMNKHKLNYSKGLESLQLPRYKRYIEIQERMISPEGAYPLFGRTLICRFGVFHALAQAAFLNLLPNKIRPSQIRCALNAVLKRQMETQGNFDLNGFLTVGFNGTQGQMAESYVSTGSAYHCCTIFMPLGLSKQDTFWIDNDIQWTSLKAFNGYEFDADKALHEKNEIKEYFVFLGYKFQTLFYKLKERFKVKRFM